MIYRVSRVSVRDLLGLRFFHRVLLFRRPFCQGEIFTLPIVLHLLATKLYESPPCTCQRDIDSLFSSPLSLNRLGPSHNSRYSSLKVNIRSRWLNQPRSFPPLSCHGGHTDHPGVRVQVQELHSARQSLERSSTLPLPPRRTWLSPPTTITRASGEEGQP